MMQRGSNDIIGRIDVKVNAGVSEDDGVNHDVFVCATGVSNLQDGKSDALTRGGAVPARIEYLSLVGWLSWSMGTM